jgi:mevalonate kinase
VQQVSARALVMAEPRQPSGMILIQAPDIGLESALADLPAGHPLAIVVNGVLQCIRAARSPAFTLRITSSIPLAAGLGSGAAVSVAIIRAVSAFLGHPLPDDQVSALAYEVEKHYHGTPSGIDNTVIAYRMPVFFIRDHPIETFQVPEPFSIVIGDTGVRSPTSAAVGDLRRRWLIDPDHYEAIFDEAGRIALAARRLIESGHLAELGSLMDDNHRLLQDMGVSSEELDRLVSAARAAGALGAKLSGGGRGGNMIALVDADTTAPVVSALQAAGAVRTLVTTVRSSTPNSSFVIPNT